MKCCVHIRHHYHHNEKSTPKIVVQWFVHCSIGYELLIDINFDGCFY